MPALPQRADTLIIGGGTTGSALAGLLAERS
jgi:L-2-hydroxyglutarate oxidase LhgO